MHESVFTGLKCVGVLWTLGVQLVWTPKRLWPVAAEPLMDRGLCHRVLGYS